jgi:hypothetical protein
LNPLLNAEADFVALQVGHQQANCTVQTIQLVRNSMMDWCYQRRIAYRLSQIPMPSTPKPSAAALLTDIAGFADVLSTPATLVKSNFASERFVVEGKRFLLVHPIGEVHFEVPAGSVAATGEFAMHPNAYTAGTTDGVEFQVEYIPAGAATIPLFRQTLQPLTQPADRAIHNFRVELPAGATGELVLRTLPGPKANFEWDWAGWSNIRFERAP